MGGLLKYSGIVTKIRAMQSHLLTDQNFEEIANLGTVTEAVTYLKSTPGYEDILRDADVNTLHRGDVEKLLTQSLYNDYSRLYSFSGLEVRRFLKLYMKRYEVDLINYCSRIVFNHYQEPFDLNYKKPFFNQYSQISIDRLMTARTMPELVEALHDTEYYKPLKKLEENGTPNLFDYDLALDLYYFNSIWKERKKVLKKQDLEMFTKSSFESAMDISRQEVLYTFRCRHLFHVDSDSISFEIRRVENTCRSRRAGRIYGRCSKDVLRKTICI